MKVRYSGLHHLDWVLKDHVELLQLALSGVGNVVEELEIRHQIRPIIIRVIPEERSVIDEGLGERANRCLPAPTRFPIPLGTPSAGRGPVATLLLVHNLRHLRLEGGLGGESMR